MTEKRQSVAEIVAGCIGLAILVGGLGWLTVAAFRSGNPWWIAGMCVLLAPLVFAGGFIAMMMTAQWLAKRRCRREGRPWRP